MTAAYRWLDGQLEPVTWTLPDVREPISVPMSVRPATARIRRRWARAGCRGRRGARSTPPPMDARCEPKRERRWRSHLLRWSCSAPDRWSYVGRRTWYVDRVLYLPAGEELARKHERAVERTIPDQAPR